MLHILSVAALAQSPPVAPQPPPGELIDVGGYRVHLYCTGTGRPAVVILGAGFSFDWSLVQPEVARSTRVCTYDASGTAWSDPGPGRGCPAWVNEVHELMKRARVGGPYVLVGASAAGVIARLYALSYPGELAGLVIVDHAFLPTPEAPAIPASGSSGLDSPPAILFQTPIFVSHEDEPGFKNLPARAQELDRWASALNPDLPTVETTGQCIAAAESAARGKAQPLGDLPLMVVSTGNDTPGYDQLQKHLLSLSRNSKQRTAWHSFHSIEISEPRVVVEAIQELLAAIGR